MLALTVLQARLHVCASHIGVVPLGLLHELGVALLLSLLPLLLPDLCLALLALHHILVDEYFFDEFFLPAVPHVFQDFLLWFFDHEIAVLAPDAVVGLVAKEGQFGNRLPRVVVLLCDLHQSVFHILSP